MTENALLDLYSNLPGSSPKFDLVGPTVDDDVRRIVNRYGYQAVREAVKRQTRQKRGRKAETDWPELSVVMKAHAREWLDGGDPFAAHSNYSIAQTYAESNPGHNRTATQRRLMRKLATSREWITLSNALTISENEYPHEAYLRTVTALMTRVDTDPWQWMLDRARSAIADYTQKFGPPEPSLTMKAVEEGSRSVMLNSLISAPMRGMMGSRAR